MSAREDMVRALAVTEQQRDAALAEVERLRADLERAPSWPDYGKAVKDRDAWRACADQLAAQVDRWGKSIPIDVETLQALVAYEQLKGTS